MSSLSDVPPPFPLKKKHIIMFFLCFGYSMCCEARFGLDIGGFPLDFRKTRGKSKARKKRECMNDDVCVFNFIFFLRMCRSCLVVPAKSKGSR